MAEATNFVSLNAERKNVTPLQLYWAQLAAEDAYAIARQRYAAGLGNYLQVLTAESTVLAQRRQQVDLAARALDVQALLAHALGGGVTPDPVPAARATPLAQNQR